MQPTAIIADNIISPLGFTTNENFRQVMLGNSGLRQRQLFGEEELSCVATIDDALIDQKFATLDTNGTYTKLEKMSILSVSTALQHTNIGDLGSHNTLLIYCSTKGNIDLLAYGTTDDSLHQDVYLYQLARKVNRFFKLKNEPIVISNACISSLQGILVGKRIIDAGLYRYVIVVGGDVVTNFTLSGFKSFNAVSNQACKPFDAQRKGINLGEAAATVVLGPSNNATRQHIAVRSGSCTNDAHHISAPSRNGEGLYQAISKTYNTLKEGNKEQTDFICAHGTATRYNDEMEAYALFRSELSHIPVCSLKGYFGHTLGASGLLESVVAAHAMLHDQKIISKGYREQGTTHQLNPIIKRTCYPMSQFLKTSSGFGGCNAAVLFSKVH